LLQKKIVTDRHDSLDTQGSYALTVFEIRKTGSRERGSPKWRAALFLGCWQMAPGCAAPHGMRLRCARHLAQHAQSVHRLRRGSLKAKASRAVSANQGHSITD
jgi:hypothetical protein